MPSCRKRVLVWEDETGCVPASSSAFDVWHRPHADNWAVDVDEVQPDLVLLDNDLGMSHRQGWEILLELRRARPDLVVFSISRHAAAVLRMALSGAIVVAKEDASRLLEELAVRWPEFTDGRGRLSRARCLDLAVVDPQMRAFLWRSYA